MKNIFSVGQINRYVKNMFTQDFILQKIYVKGEVSNCKYHTSGHIYFSLKDETGVLSCVMFAGHRRGLAFRMKDGDRVVVGGAVDVYERDGRYQLYAKEISLEGAGALYERFLALKTELEEMGMFAQEYKQPIPAFIHICSCSILLLPLSTKLTAKTLSPLFSHNLCKTPFPRCLHTKWEPYRSALRSGDKSLRLPLCPQRPVPLPLLGQKSFSEP